MKTDEPSAQSSVLGLTIGFVVLALLAVAVSASNGSLVNTLGIAVVAAGLFLPPARTAVVAGAAIALATALTLALNLDFAVFRVGNVVLASALGIAASWALDQRVRRIDQLRASQVRIFDSMSDAVAVLDNAGTLLRCNDALEAMVANAVRGKRLHPLLNHCLADDQPCPGGCLLDDPGQLPMGKDHLPVLAESITPADDRIQIGYTAARIDANSMVVNLRDVTAVVSAEQDRRALLAEATRQHERRRVVEVLSSRQHNPLPVVPGLVLDTWSVAAGQGSSAGGDLVDVSRLPDGRSLLLVVDALGGGVRSVRDAWKVLYVSRAFMMAGVTLEDLISRTTTALADENEPAKASVLAAIVDPSTGVIELATGGHPPGLLVRANGTSEWLEGTGRSVGAGQQGPARTVRARIDPGDSLIVYTDGLVDSTRDIIEGLSVLRSSAVALRDRTTAGWARGLMQAVLPADGPRNDATVLVVRLHDQPSELRQTNTTR